MKPQIIRTLHAGKGFQSSVYEVEFRGQRAAMKDFSRAPFWFKTLVAPILVSREIKALRHLKGAPHVPQFLGRVSRVAFVMELVEGKSLDKFHKGEVGPEIFEKMQGAIDEIHARGVAHGDIKRRSNLILDEKTGQIWIIDFAAAIVGKGAISKKLMRAVAEVDDKSVPRMKKLVAPELLSEADKWRLENPTSLEKWAKKLLGR